MFESLSGIQGNDAYINKNPSTVVKWASRMEIRITLQPSENSKIYVPYLYIDYVERRQTAFTTNPMGETYFETKYDYDTSNFWSVVEILFILTNIGIFFFWIVKMAVWVQYNPYRFSPQTYQIAVCVKGIVQLIDIWGYIMFYFVFIITGYWFIFFKLQDVAFVIMPSTKDYMKNYYPFEVIFGLVVTFRLISYIELIRKQSNADIFFIDWVINIFSNFRKSRKQFWIEQRIKLDLKVFGEQFSLQMN